METMRFAKFRQRMCDLLWEYHCYDISLSDEKNAERIFEQAHNICNDLVKEYEIKEKGNEKV